jgi:hypothetical protein
MSNERWNPYYKKKNHKNTSSLAAAIEGSGNAAASMNATAGGSSLSRAAVTINRNEMQIDINEAPIDLNESMISAASSINLQDLSGTTKPPTKTAVTTPVLPMQTTAIINSTTQRTAPTNLITPNTNNNQTNPALNNSTQRHSNATNNIPPMTTLTRTVLVDNVSPANPNDVETFAIRSRQVQRGTKFRSVPDTPTVSQPYTHIGYFDVKVKLEKSDDPWDELIGSTKEVFVQLWKMDPSIKIFVYERIARIHDASFIASAADFRKITFHNYEKYFFRGAPLPLGGSRTLNVLMTYTVDFNSIMRQIGPIMIGMKCGVFMRTVQAEKTTTIGWAYMSTKQTNKNSLAEAITQKIKIPIGLQWRVITTGMAGANIKEEDKVRALHFEVEDCDIQYAKRTLNDMYHHSQTEGFPLEMKFRFMPMFSSIPNTAGQDSFTTMMGFQKRFCRYIGEYLNGDIINVEGALPNGITIRQYLMNIRVDEDRRKRLFLGINKTWNNRGYVFSILPKNRDLASVTIQHLLTKLHFDFPAASEDGKVFPDIDRYFDAVAWERAQETTWDAQKNCAVAINMDNLQGTLDAMNGEDIFKTFYEQDEEKPSTRNTDEESTDKEKLMIDSDGKSIATRTRSSRRSDITTNQSTPGSGASVSFGDSVASPMTVEGLTTAGSVLTTADVHSIVQSTVQSTVLPMMTDVVDKRFNNVQDNMNGMALMLKQMQENQQSFQLQQQQHQQQQQLQQQQQQFQLQQQQLQQLQLQHQQQLQQQQHIQPQYQYDQDTHFCQDVQVMDTSLFYPDEQQQQQQQLTHHEFLAAHSMEGEQQPP